MATLTLKNVPIEVHNFFKQRAQKHQRSLNKEIIHALESIKSQGGSKDHDFGLELADKIRNSHKARLTQELFYKYRDAGRRR